VSAAYADELTIAPSILERWIERSDDACRGSLIGLHGREATHRQMLPLLRDLASGRRIIAPRSARWAGMGEGGSFNWYSSLCPPIIEPIGFGDALTQLERFACEYRESEHSTRMVLVGFDQGATMALALSALWPELFVAVVAIEGGWPELPGWSVPLRDMESMPVLIVGNAESTRAELISRNANVALLAGSGHVELPSIDLVKLIRCWLADSARVKNDEESNYA
jgi:phospholipase/carboxylesterase